MRLKVKYLILLTAALTAVENKILKFSNLLKKTDENTKISEIENKITRIMMMVNILLFKNLIS